MIIRSEQLDFIKDYQSFAIESGQTPTLYGYIRWLDLIHRFRHHLIEKPLFMKIKNEAQLDEIYELMKQSDICPIRRGSTCSDYFLSGMNPVSVYLLGKASLVFMYDQTTPFGFYDEISMEQFTIILKRSMHVQD